MENKHLPQLVMIEWLDSAQPLPSWRHLDDLPELAVVKCVSVGWLVAENDDVKMLAPNIGGCCSGENSQASGFIRIPASAVTRIVGLAEIRKKF